MTPSRVAAGSFVLSMLASAALVLVYLLGGDRAAEGILLAVALGGLGLGIVVWATRLLHVETAVEERHPLASGARAEAELDSAMKEAEPEVSRRRMLTRLLAGAGGTLVGALAIPTLSLGPRPGDSLFRTRWTAGARVVDELGEFVRPQDLSAGEVITVFPEGYVGEADSQALLIKVDESLLELPDDRSSWAPEGCVGYSKICTHAGCPVGLYRAEAHELLCPCHQSTFDVLRGADPVFGPAVRPLPQLPLEVDAEGFLVAIDDFNEPVGPSFWNVTRGDDG
jgi:ubiquinol-cytochrome c reductase iron-sulfur subunit